MNNIAIIGAGKFAYSLTSALVNSGVNVNCIISRSINSARNLAEQFGIKLFSDKLTDIPEETFLYFITVPDSEIENTAVRLAELDTARQDKMYVHCSGALDSSLLEILRSKHASVGSFHVMQTFPSRQVVEINGSYASVESDDEKCAEFLFDLAEKLKLKAFRLNRTEKTAYHLAGVFASNFLIGNIFSASKIFNGRHNTFDILEPIINSTLANIKKNGAAEALSGPVDRGDIETIKKHLAVISDSNLLASYIAQSNILLRAAEEKYSGLTENQKKIKELLEKKNKINC